MSERAAKGGVETSKRRLCFFPSTPSQLPSQTPLDSVAAHRIHSRINSVVMTQNQQQQPPPVGSAPTGKAGGGAGGGKAWEEANAKERARADQQAASGSHSAGTHKRVQVKKESSTDGSVVSGGVGGRTTAWMLTLCSIHLALQEGKVPIKQENVGSTSNVHREATPMPVPISQASSTAGPSTTSQQQAAPGQPPQRSMHAVVSGARGRIILRNLIDLPPTYPRVLSSHPS